MSFRTSIAALMGAGALAVAVATAAPSSAAPYPPADLGPTGSATVSATRILAGNTIVFGGSGFVAGTPITIAVDGVTIRTVNADAGGSFSTPVNFPNPGTYTVTGTGLEATGAAAGAATSRGGVDSSLATGATVSGAAFLSTPTVSRAAFLAAPTVSDAALVGPIRVVTAIITVLPVSAAGGGAAGAGGGSGGGSGGLPFTGLETGLLVTVAVVLIGGGLALRIGSRRRRTAT